MLQRVEDIYTAGSSELPRVPYTRFIKYLQDADHQNSLQFWKTALDGASPYHFPQKPLSAADCTPRGEVLTFTARLAVPKISDTTRSTTLRAAWALLVAAHTGSDDVVFGETLSGRDVSVPGMSAVCGPTLTTVPSRVQIPREGTVQALLEQIANSATERIPHQHVGLADIQRMDADTAAACSFQNLLAIQTGGRGPSESLWRFHNNGIQANYFTYPLVLECKAGPSAVDISAYYDANVLSAWAVQRVLYQLEAVLDQLHTVKNVRDIHFFSKHDHDLVQTWNAREPVAVDETIPSLFLQQASARPMSAAVAAWDGGFAYAELRDLAARLASELVSRGVGPEKLVPLCFAKSKWAVVGILAVLLAGGAYVPLSPEHPSSRHRQIIRDCKADLVLCSPAYERRFSDAVRDVVTVGDAIAQLPPQPARVPLTLQSTHTCYVLYTSGSTGTPKGVVIEHRAIASSSAAICQALHMKPQSRVFQFGSFAFDASVMEVLTTLTCGATVCMPSDDERTPRHGRRHQPARGHVDVSDALRRQRRRLAVGSAHARDVRSRRRGHDAGDDPQMEPGSAASERLRPHRGLRRLRSEQPGLGAGSLEHRTRAAKRPVVGRRPEEPASFVARWRRRRALHRGPLAGARLSQQPREDRRILCPCTGVHAEFRLG